MPFDVDWATDCRVCPRECGVDRTQRSGFCGAPAEVYVSSATPHFGEESPLVGAGGSGTIFMSGCNLRCVFCQNYDISHTIAGERMDVAELAGLMLSLQARGCENINFVTPTHYAAPIAEAIGRARAEGLPVPVVWNCGGYEKLETLCALEGLVDIYMPDVKFFDADACRDFLHADDYAEVVRVALKEMHRQVGDLEIRDGVATRGLLVRHLVMPGYPEDTRRIIDFLADEISPDAYVNVMGQYRPCGEARSDPRIAARPRADEIAAAKGYALQRGLRLDRR